jgi:hypothetical protein
VPVTAAAKDPSNTETLIMCTHARFVAALVTRCGIVFACLVSGLANMSPSLTNAQGGAAGAGVPLTAMEGGGASSRAASIAALAVVTLPLRPGRLADDARTGRVFVLAQAPVGPVKAEIIVLAATSGHIRASIPITVTGGGVRNGGKGSPGGRVLLGNIAVDEQNGHVFVLSSGILDRTGTPFGPGYAFMLDATTGKVLATTRLGTGSETLQAAASSMVIDVRSNRVFTDNGLTNRMNMLDASTGKLLQSIVFPNDLGPAPSDIVPLGVDGHDRRVVVHAPHNNSGLATVDERTGKDTRYVLLPDGQGAPEGVVDGFRGRAVLSIQEQNKSGDITYRIETISLASGKVIGSYSTGPYQAHMLLVDERTGRAVVYESSGQGNLDPAGVSVVDDATGSVVGGTYVSDQRNVISGGEAAATVNPVTGHALVVSKDELVSEHQPVRLTVLDMHSGKLLRAMQLPSVPIYTPLASVMVDVPSRHVFITNPGQNSVSIYDATKL